MPSNKTLADIMTRDAVTVFEEDNLLHVLTKLHDRAFHHLPVVDGSKLVGMLSQRDLLRATVAGLDKSPAARAREARYLEQTFVRDIMRPDVIVAHATDTIQSAARQLLDGRVGALPIVDEEENLLGIVTENDLVRQLADGDD